MFMSVTAPMSKNVSTPDVEQDTKHEENNASLETVTRRSSRKRMASIRYDTEIFTELQEEYGEATQEEKDPRTPHEDTEKIPKKKRTGYKSKDDDDDDDEYLPADSHEENDEEPESSDEDSA